MDEDDICIPCEQIAMIQDEGDPHTCGLSDPRSWEQWIDYYFCNLVENAQFEGLTPSHQEGFLLEIAQRCIQWTLDKDTHN